MYYPTAKIGIIFNLATQKVENYRIIFEKMATLLERISQLASNEGITIGALERKIGASKGVLSRAIQNNTDIQAKWIGKIVENYPIYSAEWLVSGTGEMKKTTSKVSPEHTFVLRTDREIDSQDIPLYNFDATAGLVAIFNDLHPVPVDFLKIPNLPPVDGAIYVRGESMSPLLKSGDIVMYKQKELVLDSILWGEIYLLSFISDGDTYTAVKYIQKSDRKNHIKLVSFNPSFAPKDIPMSSVTAMALVKASLTFHTME